MAWAFLNLFENYLYTIAIGVVILLAGFALGLLIKRFLKRILQEIKLNHAMSSIGIMYNLENGLSAIISYIVYLFTIIFFLDYLGIRTVVLYLFAGAILMLVILSVLVGLKDITPNLIGWLYLQRKKHIREGRHVEVREISGIVERVGYLETEIRTDRGDILYVPNSLFLKSKHRISA